MLPDTGLPSDDVIALRDVTKAYALGGGTVAALGGVSLRIRRGDHIAIMGPSGSGKSTLMNVLGCLDRPSTGTYYLDGTETSRLGDDELARIRNSRIGFVFQQFNLLPRVSAVEQVELPLVYAGVHNRRARALEALRAVGLGNRAHHRPSELSGGQQQRVAIARALVTQPAILLADEPTGALDSRTSEEVLALFDQLNRDRQITTIIVTHDADVARQTRRIVTIRDGRIGGDKILAPAALMADAVEGG